VTLEALFSIWNEEPEKVAGKPVLLSAFDLFYHSTKLQRLEKIENLKNQPSEEKTFDHRFQPG